MCCCIQSAAVGSNVFTLRGLADDLDIDGGISGYNLEVNTPHTVIIFITFTFCLAFKTIHFAHL